ncbi:hypothetical protein [Acidovorax sp. K2F]|uniref:hypothetical protein n=1 Tax=Acidovorax sp. K2F TaxID=2978125 RepID=UPI0021B15711|nr:hypothetical protein [Acidovorax sp. K2F]MCT6719430.1 hypothetical protein [Acidovorax sp. K2F]
MKFPDRPNGATGALVRANEFDQSPTAPFSKTRQGSQVIHKRNGDLLIRKDDNAAPPPPYLLWSGPWVQSGTESDILRRIGLDPGDAAIDEAIETTTPAIRSTNNGVYVGDGYFLDMCVSYDTSTAGVLQGASFPRLRSIDNLEGAIVPAESPLNVVGANVALDNVEPLLVAETIYGFVHPTFCACGWKDETDRYVFCIFGLLPSGSSQYRSKYVAYVGNTATRKLRRVDLPTLPDSANPLYLTGWGVGAPIYQTAWWGIETLSASPAGYVDNDQGPAKLYAVGKGHMLALLVPQERVEVGRLEGVARYSTHPLRLPAGSAPHLVRSRDFGETWTVERADFLAADLPEDTVELTDEYPDTGLDVTYDYPFQPVSWHSGFIAAPLGGGRVAIAAYGQPATPPTELDLSLHTRRMAVQRALRFFVSDTNGENFVRKPWPMDDMWACISFRDYFDPGTYTQAWPLFFPNKLPGHRYSMGPGNFTIAAVNTAVKYPEKLWGSYPDAYPVTVWATNDFGDTWTGQRLPAECMPMVDNLAEYKALKGIESGDGFSVSDATLLTRFMLSMSAPYKPADGPSAAVPPELVALYEGWRVPSSVCVTSGDVTTMRRATDFSGPSNLDPQVLNILWRSPELHYTGDIGSLLYPDDVDPAHPEFEER